MKRNRTFYISFLLVVFLLITVLAPPIVSRIKDRMLIGKVTTQQLTDTKAFTKSELSMEDKIALIAGYKAGQENVIMVNQDRQIYDQGNQQNLADIAMSEMEKLKSMGLFPPVEVSEAQNITFAVQLYTNIDDPSMNAEIWEIAFPSDKNWVDIMMDADTHLILQYNIRTRESLKYTPVKGNMNLFAKYLGIKWATTTLEKKFDTEQFKYTNKAQEYYFIQIHEDKNYGIQIVPTTD
ncbi:MAG: hypothetical protein H6Q64_664 [Firmicutes bacterium]|nr:hypothetical protein [Bacillota bacterium]